MSAPVRKCRLQRDYWGGDCAGHCGRTVARSGQVCVYCSAQLQKIHHYHLRKWKK